MTFVLGGKYVLERKIGRGGMGIVWLALDQQLKRHVAIKVLAPDRITSSRARACFEREATAIARLRNPHVVQIHDYGIDDQYPYIVMELLEGEDLEVLIQRKNQFTFDETLPIVRQVIRGLGAAHSANLVHCDLKPANLFITSSDAGPIVKILDFSVVAMMAETDEFSDLSNFCGTPSYMSPEQLRGIEVDLRTDIWSLGIITYRMLTGQLPFVSSSLGELMMQVCGRSFTPPTTLVPDLPRGIDAFFEHALAKDRTLRFQSAREMAAAFAAFGRAGQKHSVNILVVDDEPDIPDLIQHSFRSQIRAKAYSFLFADSGQAALDQLRAHSDIHIVLTDINMPTMDGLTFLGRIAEINPTAKAVMLTAYDDMHNIRTAMNRGAFDFLTKPINFADLKATIDKTFLHVEERRKGVRSIEENQTLSMFVNPTLVDRVRRLDLPDVVADESFDATIACIAIGPFETISNNDSTVHIVKTLNAHFDIIVPEIAAHQGVLDRIASHQAMAVFSGPNHLEHALKACIAIRVQLQELARRAGEQSPYAAGLSVGIATGIITTAAVGSLAFHRLEYAIMGDVASNATRLCQLAHRGQILLALPHDFAPNLSFDIEPVNPKDLSLSPQPVSLFIVRSFGSPPKPPPADVSTISKPHLKE